MGKSPGVGLVHVGSVSWEECDMEEKAREDEGQGQERRPTWARWVSDWIET